MGPSSGLTSPSLLARARENQPAAWEQLVDLYAPLVYHWCRRAGLGSEDTDDVFQEVFRSVARSLGDFRKERAGDTFRGWLRTITTNKIRDVHRLLPDEARAPGGTEAQMRLLALPDPLADEDAEEASLLSGQLHLVLETIRGEFEPRTWLAFWKVQMEGRGTDEVGAELQMTPPAVRKAKFRVLRRLREELGELLD